MGTYDNTLMYPKAVCNARFSVVHYMLIHVEKKINKIKKRIHAE